jgi:hypothetical protein
VQVQKRNALPRLFDGKTPWSIRSSATLALSVDMKFSLFVSIYQLLEADKLHCRVVTQFGADPSLQDDNFTQLSF